MANVSTEKVKSRTPVVLLIFYFIFFRIVSFLKIVGKKFFIMTKFTVSTFVKRGDKPLVVDITLT